MISLKKSLTLLTGFFWLGSSMAQLPLSDSLLVRETDHERSFIYPLGDNGFVLLYMIQPIEEEKKTWHWIHYDLHLKKITDTILPIPKKIKQSFCISEKGDVLHVFTLKMNSTEAKVWSYHISSRTFESFSLYVPGSVTPEKLIHQGKHLFIDNITTANALGNEIGRINLETRKFDFIKTGLKHPGPTSSDIYLNRSTGHLFFMVRQDDIKTSKLSVKMFDSTGTALTDFLQVPVSEKRLPATAYFIRENDSTFMIGGSYRYFSYESKYGLYTCSFNHKKPVSTYYMSFTQFDNFYNNMDSATRAGSIKHREEEIAEGNNAYSWANLMEHGITRVDSLFYFTAEDYRIYTSQNQHTIPLNNGSISWTSTATEGYQTEGALVVAISPNGKCKWNQMAPIRNSSVVYPKRPVCTFQADGDLLRNHVLLYNDYIYGTFRNDGSGFEEAYPIDNGSRMIKNEYLQGAFTYTFPLTSNKILLAAYLGTRAERTYIKSDPILVFYMITLF